MLFTADTTYKKVEITDECFVVPASDEVETINGWKYARDLVIGDILKSEEANEIIVKIEKQGDNNCILYTSEVNVYGENN